MTKMLPCPFCGEIPKAPIRCVVNTEVSPYYWEIRCCISMVKRVKEGESEQLVIDKWNTRKGDLI